MSVASRAALAQCLAREVRFTGALAVDGEYSTTLHSACNDAGVCDALNVRLRSHRIDDAPVLTLAVARCETARSPEHECGRWIAIGSIGLKNEAELIAEPPANMVWHGLPSFVDDKAELKIEIVEGDVALADDTQIQAIVTERSQECRLSFGIVSIKTKPDAMRDELNPYRGDIPDARMQLDEGY